MRRLSVIIVIALLTTMSLSACAPSQAPTTPGETAPPETTAPSEATTTPSETTPSETTPSPEEFTITIELNGAGEVLLAPSGGEYPQGTEVVLTANPKPGYEFDRWSGDLSGTDNPTTIKTDRGKFVIAHFEAIPTYSLTISIALSDAGIVTLTPPGGEYPRDTRVVVTAVAKPGYRFVKWESGDILGSSNPTTIKMDSDKYLVAVFEAIPTYTLSVTVNSICDDVYETLGLDCSAGGVSLNPAGDSYKSGTIVTLTALPSPDTDCNSYSFLSWSGDVSGTNPTITITMDSDKSVTANFKETWVCPYCEGAEFDTLEELQEHVRSEHPGERIPIIVKWD